jgi:hypothetical protein
VNMDRLGRLADILEYKYAAIRKVTPLNVIRDGLINAYRLYVNKETAKEPVIQMVADAGEPFSAKLLDDMHNMIAHIDRLPAKDLFHMVGQLLGDIRAVKEDPAKTVRNFIHDAIRIRKESDRNYREHVKSKFEQALFRLSSMLEKSALELQHFTQLEGPLEGTVVEPERKQLSKEKVFMFMKTPAAQFYKLDNMDVMQQILQYPETKERLTTLINAIDRGHIPADGPEVMAEARAIKSWLDAKEKTNLPALEQMPEKPGPATLFEEEGEGEETK